MERKRIYITVKTYPTISSKYDELVCTAGILEDGSWIRLYPLPFRKLSNDQKYSKYQWIEADVEKNEKDKRLESYRVVNRDTIQAIPLFNTKKTPWEERKQIIFKNKKIFTNLSKLIALAKEKNVSFGIFKPSRIIKIIHEGTDRDWPKEKIEQLAYKKKQLSLFETEDEIVKQFEVVQKIPYKFSYVFLDDTGKESTLMIEDWEIGMLYLHCLESTNGNEMQALEKVKSKYYNEFIKTDLYFFLGTTLEFHWMAPNPFIIVGIFHPPIDKQRALF
ncbi:hypothetical protein LQZ19_03585 [Treponema primitia]|uniref:hypothetical protein n=1 Tax=Treponema primitia TaxID=88058 RepID=UPI00398046E2